jgi:hypothetical protein
VKIGGPEFYSLSPKKEETFSSINIEGFSVIITVKFSWAVCRFGRVPLKMSSNVPLVLWKATLIERACGSKERKDGTGAPDFEVRE